MPTVTLYTIDPDGDTLIILPFSQDDSSSTRSSNSSSSASSIASSNGTETQPSSPEPEAHCDEACHGANKNTKNTANAGHDLFKDGIRVPESPKKLSTVSETEAHFRVSTKHLSLSSRRARVMFQGPYEESVPKADDGLRRWVFEPIFDPRAFEVIMNIIHLQTHKIPDRMSLPMMVHLAAIVDDLECHSAVDFFAKIWLNKLVPGILDRLQPRELSYWVLVSSVFGQKELFQEATRRVILYSTYSISAYGLPIRPKIIEIMEQKRESTIHRIVKQLNDLMIKLSNDGQVCATECQSMLLGALVRQMHTAKLLSPLPTRSYDGVSVLDLLRTVRGFTSPKIYCPRGLAALEEESTVWFLEQRNPSSGVPPGQIRRQKKMLPPLPSSSSALSIASSHGPANSPQQPKSLVAHKCSLQTQIEPELKQLELEIKGLNLADFYS